MWTLLSYVLKRLSLPLWLAGFFGILSLPTFFSGNHVDEEVAFMPSKINPNIKSRMDLIHVPDLSAGGGTDPFVRYPTSGEVDPSATTTVFTTYYEILKNTFNTTHIFPTGLAAAPRGFIVHLTATRSDPREVSVIEFPMNLWHSANEDWFAFTVTWLRNWHRKPYQSKDLIVGYTPSHTMIGDNVLNLAAGSRRFLSNILDKSNNYTGIPRLALVLVPPSADHSNNLRVDYEGLDLTSANSDYLFELLQTSANLGLNPIWRQPYDSILFQLLSSPADLPHSAYLERQICAATLRLGSREQYPRLAAFLDYHGKEEQKVVLQFHHGSNQYFVSGLSTLIIPNSWLICMLLMTLAPMLLDVGTLLGSEGIPSFLNRKKPAPRAGTYQNILTKVSCGLLIATIPPTVAISAVYLILKLYHHDYTTSSCLDGSLDLHYKNGHALRTLCGTTLLSMFLTIIVLDKLASKRNEDSKPDLFKALALGLRISCPWIVFMAAMESPSLALVSSPILSFLGYISYVYNEKSKDWAEGVTLATLLILFARVRHTQIVIDPQSRGFIYDAVLRVINAILETNLLYFLKDFTQSVLFNRLTTSPLILLDDIVTRALKTHLCLGSNLYPMLLLVISYGIMLLATILVAMGIQGRKITQSWMRKDPPDQVLTNLSSGVKIKDL